MTSPVVWGTYKIESQKYLLAEKGQAMDAIPSTKAALEQYIIKAKKMERIVQVQESSLEM